jgi:hypothetical protein
MDVNVGDRVEVEGERVGQAPRCGVVTALSGPLVTVRWDDGHQSAYAPAGGSMRVRGRGEETAHGHPG